MPRQKGFKHSEETKKKMSKSHMNRIPGMLNKKHTKKTRQKMSNIAKEKGFGKWNKNRKFTPERIEKMRFNVLGKRNPNFKGGKHIDKEGYVCILKTTHPFCSNKGYVKEHRLIVESQIGRYLLPKEKCHHLNKIKNDNRPKNLIAFINDSIHQRFHHNPNNIKPEEIIFDGRHI